MRNRILTLGILFLLVFSTVIPMSLGENVRTSNEKEIQSSASRDGGLMDSAWPMFAHDIRHTGRSPYGPSSGNWPIVKWKFRMERMTISSPAIDENGTIYIGAHDSPGFFSVNPDGSKKWHFDTGDWVDSSPAIGADGTIYFGCNNGRLFAVNPDGSEKWWRGLGDGWVKSSPVIDDNGIIYAASVGSSRLCAVYPNGTIKWMFHANDYIYCSPAIDDNKIIYIGSNDGYMYAVYSNNGTMKWKFYAGGIKGIGSAPTIEADGTIYFGCTNGYLYALHSNGTLKWKYNTGFYIGGSSPAISEDGTLYVGTNNRKIYSINSDGKKNWEYNVNNEISASPVIDKYGIVYCGDWDGYLYALNPDGTLRWKFSAGDSIESSLAISEDGTIYIAAQFQPSDDQSSYSYLYALEVIKNEPPDKPMIEGPTIVKVGEDNEFTFSSVDPDGDNVSLIIDWDLGDITGWLDYVESGSEIKLKHNWSVRGVYKIQCKAKDVFGSESKIMIFYVEVVKKSRQTSPFLGFPWLLDRFPILHRLISNLF